MSDTELVDPLPEKLRSTVNAKLKNDLIVCAVIGTLSFGIHRTTVFTALQPELNPVLWSIVSCLGFLLYYIVPQLHKQLPWLCLSRPVLRSHEHAQFEVREPVRIIWFEKAYVGLCFLERNVLYPVVFLRILLLIMTIKCCIHTCTNIYKSKGRKVGDKNNNKTLMFHRFPRNEGQKARWINNIRNINGSTWEPKDPLFVCSEHFDRFSWERVREDGKRKLKIGAIPSVFNDSLPSKPFNEHTYSMPLQDIYINYDKFSFL